jgi:hypothetical protein
MHLHQSIIDIETGKNIFSNEDGTMSQLFLHHIGGLQKHIPELLPLFAPNVNSFRRFLPDTSAPVNVEWGEETVPWACGCRMRGRRIVGWKTACRAPMPTRTWRLPRACSAVTSAWSKA